jgi:GrpB-like predicted nucleotidyltransferase (UPF0157 family)
MEALAADSWHVYQSGGRDVHFALLTGDILTEVPPTRQELRDPAGLPL